MQRGIWSSLESLNMTFTCKPQGAVLFSSASQPSPHFHFTQLYNHPLQPHFTQFHSCPHPSSSFHFTWFFSCYPYFTQLHSHPPVLLSFTVILLLYSFYTALQLSPHFTQVHSCSPTVLLSFTAILPILLNFTAILLFHFAQLHTPPPPLFYSVSQLSLCPILISFTTEFTGYNTSFSQAKLSD